jgi:DNA-binding Xre family transcriptional regulator
MALKLKVDEVARKLGIENAAQLATHTGLGLTSCYQLWEGRAKMISLRTLNTLCNRLRAHPALLFEYTPDPDEASFVREAHRKIQTRRSRIRRK